jgi:benzoyl-CoA reductase subunit C
MDLIGPFQRSSRDRYRLLQEQKDKGKRIMGWVCTYVPEEIIHAAGFLPIRVMGGEGKTPTADAYLYSNVCSFARSCLEEGFTNRYDFLEGFVTVTACDHIRRLYDVWYRYLDTPFKHIINLPHKVTEDAIDFFKGDLEIFKRRLEEYSGKEITTRGLKESIQLYNRTRVLLKRIYELKKLASPPLTGAETMEVVLAGMVLPKEDYNLMLEELLEGLPRKSDANKGMIRLLISGSELDHPEYIRVIEELGCLVAIDDLCVGARYFWDLVDEELEPMEALARRYLAKAPCSRMRPGDRRAEHLRSLVEDYKVDGIIYELLKFCDLYSEDIPVIREKGNLGVPILALDREYAMAGLGQIKTRVQAFLESFGG